MRPSTLLTLFLAALPFTAAFTPHSFDLTRRETTTASNSTCPSQQPSVDSCVASLEPAVNVCTNDNKGPVDYCCLCSTYTEKLGCYDNCTTDPQRTQVNKQLNFYCAAAEDPCQATCLTNLLGLVAPCSGATANSCMCNAYNVTLECYAGCPLAAPNPGAEADRDRFCAAAKNETSSAVQTPTPTPRVSGCPAARRSGSSSVVLSSTKRVATSTYYA